MRCVFIIALGIISQLCFSQSQYRFQNYDSRDGLVDNYVFSIRQDSLGYMWFQYYGGLTRFDGYSFKVYKHDPDDSLRAALNFLLGALRLDGKKNVWITKHEFPRRSPLMLVKHDPKTDGFVKLTSDLTTTFINDYEFDKSKSLIWLGMNSGKGLYCLNMETKKIDEYLNPSSDEETFLDQNTVHSSMDIGTSLLLATKKGFWSFDKDSKTFKRPSCNPKDSAFIYHAPFFDFLKRIGGNLWVFASNAVIKLGADFSVLQRFNFPPGFNLSSLAVDDEEVFWFGTWTQGLYRYDPRDSSFTNIRHVPGDPHSLKTDGVNTVAVDRDQNIWIGTSKGISKLQRQPIESVNLGGRDGVGGIYKTKDKEFVICHNLTEGLPFNSFEILVGEILPGPPAPIQFRKLPIPPIKTVVITHVLQGKHNFWVRTFPNGILAFPIDSKSGMIRPGPPVELGHDPANPNTIGQSGIGAIWEDDEENLWVGTQGLHKIDPRIPYGEKGSVITYKHLDADTNSISSNTIFQIYPEDEKSFWVLTDAGVDLFHRDTEKFEHLFQGREMPFILHKTADGTLFLATLKGLYEAKKGRQRFYGRPIWARGEINAIREDRLGRLWLHGPMGLVCYDRKKKVAIELNEDDGMLYSRSHEVGRLFQTSHGGLISFGEGLTWINPMTLTIDQKKTNPVLTRLEVNNKAPVIGQRTGDNDNFFLNRDISMLQELVLDHRHNNFSIEFSALELTAPQKNLYRHKLEGYDKDWIETDYKNRLATYTNLNAGTYVFKVKASNHHGVWSDQETILNVTILPPPWKTWWAYSLYLFALIGAVVLWRNYEVKRVKLKHRAEHLAEVDQLKSRFFANISHEFRTPITLVLGPLKDFQKKLTDPEQKNVIGAVIRNGQRLQRLINQLLDLSKVEAGKMKLLASHVDLVQLLREITASYESLAKEKNIRYFFNPEVNELMVYVDEEKIEKIVHNILSNAFKFTKQGGQIILNLKVQEKSAVIALTDSGIGIPEDQLDKIFDRFYQVDSSQTRGYEGTGLGLALVKDLVELHHGKVSVDSKEGKGTTFTVSLPLGKGHLQKDEIVEKGVFEKTELLSGEFISSNGGAGIEKEKAKETALEHPVVLIVEDNADMRQYIRKTLSTHYQIIEAENGRVGVSKAEESMPDLIISDIMMPEMDGYKLCSIIKSKELTSHIPVILLTAKADRESKLSGLETGADDYLSKPFDTEELKLIVRNRIEERRKMREHFSREITLEPKQVAITSLDEKFISKVLTMIERHIDDEEFSIEDFSQEAGCSRMQFYRKIKGLTDQTPSQFVRSIRLKRAAQLLLAKSDNVSQIAYSVGFSSLAYFNKCFREQFGVTPGQYAEANKTRV